MVGTGSPSILAVNGSERDGNTAELLRYAGDLAAKRGVAVEVVELRRLRVTPCGPCGDCNVRTVPCAVDDDVPAVVDRMIAADGIIYAAPVHGFGATPLMQAFIERSGVGHLRFDRPLTNKVAGVIAVGRRYSQTELWTQLTLNALLNRMIVVGSGFPAVVRGHLPGEAMEDDEGVVNLARMVDRMIDMIEVLRAYRDLTGRDGPAPGPRNERVGLRFG